MGGAVFKAKQEDGKDIVVKFVDWYNSKAHHLLADSNLAPKLYYAETDDQPTHRQTGGLSLLVPHLKMIVMEFVPARTAGKAFAPQVKSGEPQTETAHNFFQDIANAIKILQKENLVFGDLRTSNILVVGAGKGAKLIDFDWCGEDGKARYPRTLNDNSGISWPPGVGWDAVMQKEHDNWMLAHLKTFFA